MNNLRTVMVILFISLTCLLMAGCTTTEAPPTRTVELKPTNTPEPTETETTVPSPTVTPQPSPTIEPSATATDLPSPTYTPTATVGNAHLNTPEHEDLGIEHLQIGQESILEGDSFYIELLNEPDGDGVAVVVKGSTVTVQDFTVYDDVYWYLVETEDGSGWVNEYRFIPMGQVSYSVTPTALSVHMLPWLVTAVDMNELDNVLEIYDWQLSSEIANDSRVCHDFYGTSWSLNPNLSINCIFPVPAGTPFERAIEVMFEWGILAPSAVSLELVNEYDYEAAIFGDRYQNGHAVFDLFVEGDEALYWASVSLGLPAGATVADMYQTYGADIETFLFDMIQKNLKKREIDTTPNP